MSNLSNKDILYFSRFYNNPNGNGGDKRTAQICEMLDGIDYELISICQSPFKIPHDINDFLHNPLHLYSKIKSKFFKQHCTYSKYNRWSVGFREYVVFLHLQAKLFTDSLKKISPKVLLLDDPVFLAPALFYAKSKHIRVVALCHNLETLSREQVVYSHQYEMFKYELEILNQCDLVVTISTEETFLLRNFGLDPVYLPYFPSGKSAERFLTVRKSRYGRSKVNFLLLGTVHNIPTLHGMKKAINEIIGKNVLSDDKLLVAGYGTRELLGHFDDARIELRGEVTDDELDEMLVETKGCIVYQENGSGALTKIPELLTAGVPVIVNSHAARSYHHLPGIFEFTSIEQLGEQMERAAEHDQFPHVLCPPAADLLRERILNLSQCI